MENICKYYRVLQSELSSEINWNINNPLLANLGISLASLGSFAFGISHLWPAPIIPKLLNNDLNNQTISTITISTSEASWIASCGMIVLPFTSIITMFLVKRFGSKYVLLLTSIPLLISWILIIYANSVIYFYIARVLVGTAHAFCYGSASIYISEVAEPNIRGILNFFISIMFNFGTLITYSLAYSLSIDYFAKLAFITPAVHFIIFFGMPQSPYYLITCNKLDKARQSLRLLRGNTYTELEFQTIKENVQKEMENKPNVKSLFNNSAGRKSVGLLTMMALLQQLTGTSSIGNYLHLIVQEANIQLNVELAASISVLVMIVSLICSIFFIDRKGRRPLTFISAIGAGISITLEGVYFYLKENNYYFIEQFSIVSFILLLMYVFFIGCGLCFMAVILAGELFPANVRSYGAAIALIVYGIFGTLANKGFQIIMDAYDMSCIFFIFGGFCFLALIATYFLLPETRNKSLAEIQIMLRGKSKIINPI